MTWIAILLAVSAPSCKLASFTAPQVYPDANGKHSATGLPPLVELICCGRLIEGSRALAKTRRPTDPVSTRIWSMVWHEVGAAGEHSVTLVVSIFRFEYAVVSTLRGTELLATGAGVPDGLLPPQAVKNSNGKAMKQGRMKVDSARKGRITSKLTTQCELIMTSLLSDYVII